MNQQIKTSIERELDSGFALTESDVRRIYQIAHESSKKTGDDDSITRLMLKAKNGNVYEPASIDDLFGVENSAAKPIELLSMIISSRPVGNDELDERAENGWGIYIRFGKPPPRSFSRAPITFTVHGPSRDWVMLTAGELEERIKTTRRLSLIRLITRPDLTSIFLCACLLTLTLIASAFITPKADFVYKGLVELQAQGKLQTIADAVIETERLRSQDPNKEAIFRYYLFGMAAATFAIFGIPFIARQFSLPYIFNWGEISGLHERRRSWAFVGWTVVVLGLVVGVASTWISKFFGL